MAAAGLALLLFIFACVGAFAPVLTEKFVSRDLTTKASLTYWRMTLTIDGKIGGNEEGVHESLSLSSSEAFVIIGSQASKPFRMKNPAPCANWTKDADCDLDFPCGDLEGGTAKDNCNLQKDQCNEDRSLCAKFKASFTFAIITWILSIPTLVLAILPIIGKLPVRMAFGIPAIMILTSLISWAIVASLKTVVTNNDGEMEQQHLLFSNGDADDDIEVSCGASWPFELNTWVFSFFVSGLLFVAGKPESHD